MAEKRLLKPSHGRKYPHSCNRYERPESSSGWEMSYRAFKVYRFELKLNKYIYGYTGLWTDIDSDTILANVEIVGGVDYGPGLVRTSQRYVGNAAYLDKEVEANSLPSQPNLLPFKPKSKVAVYANNIPDVCMGVIFFDVDMINVPYLHINFAFETANLRIRRCQ